MRFSGYHVCFIISQIKCCSSLYCKRRKKKIASLSFKRDVIYMDQTTSFNLYNRENTSPQNYKLLYLICRWINFAWTLLFTHCLKNKHRNVFGPKFRILIFLSDFPAHTLAFNGSSELKLTIFRFFSLICIDGVEKIRFWSFLGIFKFYFCES